MTDHSAIAKEPVSDKIKGFLWTNGLYIVFAAIAVAAFLMFGVVTLAVTVSALVFTGVAVFVGGMSSSLWRGLAAGALATLPVALLFLWILK